MCEIHSTRHDTCLEYSACENCLCLLLLCSNKRQQPSTCEWSLCSVSQVETWLPHCNNGHLMWWAITITHTPPIIVACKIWQTMTVLYKLLCGMKVMVYNTWEIREEDVRLWCGWKVHLVGSYNPWRHKEGNNPGTSWSTHFQLPLPYTLPVTMALHISSYHGPTHFQLPWPYVCRSLVTVHNGAISIKWQRSSTTWTKTFACGWNHCYIHVAVCDPCTVNNSCYAITNQTTCFRTHRLSWHSCCYEAKKKKVKAVLWTRLWGMVVAQWL